VAADGAAPSEAVIGMVGLQPPGDEVPMATLCGGQGIVQLKRMRVAP
jgi:ribosomal protein S18 acetylase RimI-like enzyme